MQPVHISQAHIQGVVSQGVGASLGVPQPRPIAEPHHAMRGSLHRNLRHISDYNHAFKIRERVGGYCC